MNFPWYHPPRSVIGKFVVEIVTFGCMAEQDRLRRVMLCEEIGDQRKYIPGSQSIRMARCRVLYSYDGFGVDDYVNVPIDDGGFQVETHDGDTQQHYVWRH